MVKLSGVLIPGTTISAPKGSVVIPSLVGCLHSSKAAAEFLEFDPSSLGGGGSNGGKKLKDEQFIDVLTFGSGQHKCKCGVSSSLSPPPLFIAAC